ncbi:MAG: pyruvate dehydrogenase (acetyl-transferring) E1 component subunit alpha, partial [Deltaproteobacteria bacterium]|nr:pyruvate dehydrogenase (acetyl-transferring) E1 component subunit alpha [Deltaproteobacteria bacterium]
SVPREKQTASKTIAQKAIAYGFDGICVDGMDAIAMYHVMNEALDNARSGKGPTLIEAMTYRLCDHTTADNASLYQDPAETERWKARDGVERLRKLLLSKGWWSDADETTIQAEAEKLVGEVVATIESTPAQTPNDIFCSMYATMTPRLDRQLQEVKEHHPHGNAHEH